MSTKFPPGPAAAAVLLAFAATVPAAPGHGEEVESVVTSAGPISVTSVAEDLERPWGMAVLPDGRLLVTEQAGRLRIISLDGDQESPTISGTPEVFAQGQGGLMDVALHPDFAQNRLVYLSFARPGPNETAATALGRGEIRNDQLYNFEVIFTQEPWINGPNHFGNRIVFDNDGHVFLTLGERFQFDPAQDLGNHLGKVVRLNDDGSIPQDNPFAGQEGAQAAIWSYGHRNIEAAALHPDTGALWVGEMGPLGGDELNQPQAGKNYGWPVVSWGIHYDGKDIPDPPTQPQFEDAVAHFSPVFSPSGMIFYTGKAFPAWQGSAILSGLSGHQLVRLTIEGDKVTEEERVPLPNRIRDVAQTADGNLYVLVSPLETPGSLWRIAPLK